MFTDKRGQRAKYKMSHECLEKNGKGGCHPYDGACDIGGNCSSNCKRQHKRRSNKSRRNWNKKILKYEIKEVAGKI